MLTQSITGIMKSELHKKMTSTLSPIWFFNCREISLSIRGLPSTAVELWVWMIVKLIYSSSTSLTNFVFSFIRSFIWKNYNTSTITLSRSYICYEKSHIICRKFVAVQQFTPISIFVLIIDHRLVAKDSLSYASSYILIFTHTLH